MELTTVVAQDGLLTRKQVRDLGVSQAKLRNELDHGSWRMVLPNVYATFTGSLSQRQFLIAACLYAGAHAQLTGSAALHVYGFRQIPSDDEVRLLIPHGRHLEPIDWVRPHRTRRMDPMARRYGVLHVVSLPRAVLDAARRIENRAQIHNLLTEAVAHPLGSLAGLRAELADGPRQHSAKLRHMIADMLNRAARSPHAVVREALDQSPILPTIAWDPVLHSASGRPLPAPDGWISEVDLGIELAPVGERATLHGWSNTLHRQADLARHGAVILRFAPEQVRGDPGEIRRTVEEVYLDRLRRGIRGTLHATQHGQA